MSVLTRQDKGPDLVLIAALVHGAVGTLRPIARTLVVTPIAVIITRVLEYDPQPDRREDNEIQ